MAEPPAGLPDQEVRERISELDRLLEYLEQASGPVAGPALAAVSALTQIYGTALARVTSLAAAAPPVMAGLAADEVISHLLILHGLHPQTAAQRAARALAALRPRLQADGGDAELVSVTGGVATVRLSGSCQGCAAAAATRQHEIAEAVLTAAPELAKVEPAGGPGATELIPAESLLRKPAAAGGHRGGPP